MRYVLQLAEKSHCKDCGSVVSLLIKYDGNGPAFYVCWQCKTVAQVGKGLVLPR